MRGDEKQSVELTQRFFIKPKSGLISLNEAKCDKDKIV